MQNTFQEKDRSILLRLRFEKVVCYLGSFIYYRRKATWDGP